VYSSPYIIGIIKLIKIRLARHITEMGHNINAYRNLVGTLEERGPLGRRGCK
jgi:hypothetical protein